MLLTTLMNNIISINNIHYVMDDRYEYVCILVGGIPTPLKNIKVNWDDYSQYMGK
jgi:hypothetical protein